MWHDDNWQPYGEYDAPATSSWRHNRAAGPALPPGASSMNGPYGRYTRQFQPYNRPQPAMPPQHSPTLAAAAREMSWRNANSGWGPPRMRNGVAAMSPMWHDEVAAYHHHQQQLARAHARALHEAALSKLSSVEITTPHAGGDLRAKPIVCESSEKDQNGGSENGGGIVGPFNDDHSTELASSKRPLYNDFSEPEKPREIELRFEKSAVKITVSWTVPELPSLFKYKQRIEVRDSLTIIEEDILAAHITSFRFKTTPGSEYTVALTIFDTKGVTVATARKKCKAVFSLDEIDKLLTKAIDFIGTAMQPFSFLYRCKPKIYWDDIYLRRNGIMERYMKDNNGQAASPINGEISGMFFSAKTLADGSLPPSSPFGDIRMILPAISLLDPTRISAFFCDFYCNSRLTHYVTIVICERNSQTERFCNEKLRPLDLKDNRFLRITPTNNPNMPYAFYTNRSVWVEIYYTENIPMNWGRFDHIIATGAGTSKIGGVPHNKSCLTCNLYPIGPQADSATESVEDLVASYENDQANQRLVDGTDYTSMFPRNSTRYTTLGCIQAELLAPSTPLNSEISKDNYLDVAEMLVYCVDRVVYDDSQQRLKKIFNSNAEVLKNSPENEVVVEEEKMADKTEKKSKKDAEEKEEIEAEKRSSALKKILDRLPTSVPGVSNLVSKIRAIAKEMDSNFKKINNDIGVKLGKKRPLKSKENQTDNDEVEDGPEAKSARTIGESWRPKESMATLPYSLPYHSLKKGMNEVKEAPCVVTIDDDNEKGAEKVAEKKEVSTKEAGVKTLSGSSNGVNVKVEISGDDCAANSIINAPTKEVKRENPVPAT